MSEKAFWDEEYEIARIPRSDRGDEIVVKNVKKDGREYIDVRVWYMTKAGEQKPGKGLAIPADLGSEVATAIEEAAGRW